jgi:hypothetical protein
MYGVKLAATLLWLMRLPCLPVELGGFGPPRPIVPPADAPPDADAPAVALPSPPRFPAPPAAPPPAPLAMHEQARYRVDYGVLSIGEIRLSIDGPPARDGERLVRAAGVGAGAILGLGRMENRVDAQFDAQGLASRRWVSARRSGDGGLRDIIEQPRQGHVDLVRERDGAPAQRQAANLPGPTLDPVSFLLRLRVAPPPPGGPPQVLQLMDGQALWRVTIASVARTPLSAAVAGLASLRLEAHADPIRFDGSPDEGDRHRRDFVLWLSGDPAHVPLRLEMPIGPGDLVVALVDIQRVSQPQP